MLSSMAGGVKGEERVWVRENYSRLFMVSK